MTVREKLLIGGAVVIGVGLGIPMTLGAMQGSQSPDAAVGQLKLKRRSVERQVKLASAQVALLEPNVQAMSWDLEPDGLRQAIVNRATTLAQQAGMTLVTTRPLKPRPLDLMTEVSVDLHLTGVLGNLVKFLFPLQQPGSRLSVDRVRIAATNADTNLIDCDVTVSAYTLQGARPAAPPRKVL